MVFNIPVYRLNGLAGAKFLKDWINCAITNLSYKPALLLTRPGFNSCFISGPFETMKLISK